MFPTYSRSLDILDKYYDTNLNPASPSILIYQCQSQRVINVFDSQQSHRVITYSGTASSAQNFPTSPKDMVFRSAPNSKFSYHPHQHKFSYSFFYIFTLMYDFTVQRNQCSLYCLSSASMWRLRGCIDGGLAASPTRRHSPHSTNRFSNLHALICI